MLKRILSSKLCLETIYCICLFALLFITRKDFLSINFFWDELVYGGSALNLFRLGPIHLLQFQDYLYHPPMLQIMQAIFYLITAPEAYYSRVLTLLMSGLHLIYVFKICNFLEFKKTSYIVPIILFSFPIFYIHTTMLIADNAISLFIMAQIYHYLRDHTKTSFVVGIIGGLLRETAILSTVFIVIHLFLKRERRVSKYLYAMAPVFSLTAFWLIQKFFGATLLDHINFQQNHLIFSVDVFRGLFFFQLQNVFFNFDHVLFTSLTLSGTALLFFKEKKSPLELLSQDQKYFLISSISIILATIFFYSFHTMAIPRYFLVLSPILLICSTIPFLHLARLRLSFLPIVLLYALSFDYSKNKEMPHSGFEYTNSFFTTAKHHEKLMSTLELISSVQDKIILTAWPYEKMLSEPIFKYVKRPFKTTKDTNADFSCLYWSNYIAPPLYGDDTLSKIVTQFNLKLIDSFEDRFLRIYLYCK